MTESRLSWWSSPRHWIRAILMLDDSPHAIALGSAIGMFVAFTPTVGAQMLIVACIALATRRWFHFNRLAAMVMIYISNPLTVVPIYWFMFKIGAIWFPADVTRQDFAQLLEYEGLDQWWNTMVGLFIDIGLPLLVGSAIVATATAIPTYPAIIWLMRHVRPERRGAEPAPVAAPGDAGSAGAPETPPPAAHRNIA